MPLRLSPVIAALIALAVCVTPASAALHLSKIGDFSTPVYVTAPPGDPHRVFVVEQAGRIMEVRDGVEQASPFLDIRSKVKSGGEQGLLSMAFAPDYARSGRYYVYYTAPPPPGGSGNVITVEEYSPGEHHVVFTVDHPLYPNHNGGQLQFGPDGLLYAGTGDGGSGNDPSNNAQNLSSNLGKLLRINPTAAGARPQIYAFGLRNPFRFSFDRQTGDLVIGDVGQANWEEVDFSPAGLTTVRDYGWRCREGFHANPNVSCTAKSPVVDPVLEKAHSSTGFCAIIGGYVVRDPALGALNGRYVYGDNCVSDIWSVHLPDASGDSTTGLTVNSLSSFGEDSCGHLYATSLNGPVYRIDGDTFSPCPAGVGDGRPLQLTLTARAQQHAVRNGGFWVRARCNELCGINVAGTFRVRGSKRVYSLKRGSRLIAAGRQAKITLKPWSRGMRVLRAALKKGRRVNATITATALDSSKNHATRTKQIRAIR